ncbi:hypothetical protein Ahia01_000856000, partial [Argonauta hians]
GSNSLNYGEPKRFSSDQRKFGKCFVPSRSETNSLRLGNRRSVRHYPRNSPFILVVVDLTEFQPGFFEFRVCPSSLRQDRNCSKTDTVKIMETGESLYYPRSRGIHHINLVLPEKSSCSHCVLQWKYKTSCCSNGDLLNTRSDQTQFYHCADIVFDEIVSNTRSLRDEKMEQTNNNNKRLKRDVLSKCRPGQKCWPQVQYHQRSEPVKNKGSFSAVFLLEEDLLPSGRSLREEEEMRNSDIDIDSSSGHHPSEAAAAAVASSSSSSSSSSSKDVNEYGSGDLGSGSGYFPGDESIGQPHFTKKPQVKTTTLNSSNQKISSSDSEQKQKLVLKPVSADLPSTHADSVSDDLVSEELLGVPSRTDKNNSTVSQTKDSLISSNNPLNGTISKETNSPKIVPTAEPITLTGSQQAEATRKPSLSQPSDNNEKKVKGKKHCEWGKDCLLKKDDCIKDIECSEVGNGKIRCVTVESCSMINDIFPGFPRCNDPRKTIKCKGRGMYRYMRGMSAWCENMCNTKGCELTVCNCDCRRVVACRATGLFKIVPGSTVWCQANCAHNYCPPTHCHCQ